MNVQTEFDFSLPIGYVDEEGTMHRAGTMRLATAMDEIAPLRDPRVRANQAYLVIILLARVIVKLGSLPMVTTGVVENLFAADLAYLQALYRQINEQGTSQHDPHLPGVQEPVRARPGRTGGGIVGYPLDRLHEEVAYIAYHLHWPHDDILKLEHTERQRWVEEIARINRRLNEAQS